MTPSLCPLWLSISLSSMTLCLYFSYDSPSLCLYVSCDSPSLFLQWLSVSMSAITFHLSVCYDSVSPSAISLSLLLSLKLGYQWCCHGDRLENIPLKNMHKTLIEILITLLYSLLLSLFTLGIYIFWFWVVCSPVCRLWNIAYCQWFIKASLF